MVYYFCHCMCLHKCPGENFILDSRLVIFFFWKGTVLLAFCLYCFDCGAVALSASVFPFGVLDGSCYVIVLIPDHCLPFYLQRLGRESNPQNPERKALVTEPLRR